MTAKTLMIQGTGSSVGKSILVAALCRIFKQDGISVAPYKSQNMSLNSFVTRDGGEMGRAQVVQAEAAGIEPSVDMNPILLKPEADARSQVVLLGRPDQALPANQYYLHTPRLLQVAQECLDRLRKQYDLVLIEGAGSPAEINLKAREIVNMRIAKIAEAPVLLVGDIDKGGVFASLVGTLALLDDEERSYVKGFIINKFRGDVSILQPGLDQLERMTSLPVIGVVPYYKHIFIDEEDSVRHQEHANSPDIDIAVIYHQHISNSTDFEPLQREEGVCIRYIKRAEELGQPDIIILPGSKSTISDLAQLRENGLAAAITNQARANTLVLGICGGFQMLGNRINDPKHTESDEDSVPGLGLLDVITSFESAKTTWQVKAKVVGQKGIFSLLCGYEIDGYEIHMGQTFHAHTTPIFQILRRGTQYTDHLDGAVDDSGLVMGTYLHGLFENDSLRHAFVSELRSRKGLDTIREQFSLAKDYEYDLLADHVRQGLNMNLVRQICGL